MDFDQVTVNGVNSNAFCGYGISDKNISKNPVKALDSFIFTGYNEQACNKNAVFLLPQHIQEIASGRS